MEEVLKANVFFFVTSAAVVIFTLLLCVAVYHVIKALRTLRKILDRVEEGTEVIAEDFENVRTYFTQEGLLPRLLGTLMGTRKKAKEKKQKQDKNGRN
jgi:hypothetical protein